MDTGPDKKDAIDGMRDSLYSRAHGPKLNIESRTPLEDEEETHPPVAWDDTKIDPDDKEPQHHIMSKPRMSAASKFFIGSFVFFLIAAGIGSYMLFVSGSGVSPQNIDVQVVASSIIDGGKESTFEIIVNNRNQLPIQLADISIQYPEGARSAQDETRPLTYERQTIGTIGPGEQVRRTSNAVFYGQEGSAQKVQVTLDYSVQGSNSIFQKHGEANFTIGSSPVSISVDSPKEAIAGQPFAMDVTVTSNSATPIPNVVLQTQLPFGYTAVSSDPPALSTGTSWQLGTLNPGTSKLVHIVGTIDGQDGDQRVFRFLTGSDADPSGTLKVPFIIVPQTLTVHRPFISADITLEGKTGKTVSIVSGKVVTGSVKWKNNLSVPVSNVQMSLLLSGSILDTNNIGSTDGFYQSQNHTITWTKEQNTALAVIPPGGSGSFSYSFATFAPDSPATAVANPTVDLKLSVTGERQGETGVPEVVSSDATLKASIASQVALKVQVLHFIGPFTNTGPMPPIPEEPTTYTVVWTVTNSSNTIANAVASAVLPSYVSYITTTPGSGIVYDKASHTVSWSLGDLKAGAGFSTAERVAAFQIVLLPSASQGGFTPTLTSDIKLNGQDRFAQVPVHLTVVGPTTALKVKDDPNFVRGMETVQNKQ